MRNFEALVDQATGSGKCKSAGCCFNEESFLEGGDACYRASNYGQCSNLPEHYNKIECGYEGIDETTCMTNPRCCYAPSEIAGTPWCFYKYSATLDENQWCEAWTLLEHRGRARTPCFNNGKSKANIFTNTLSHSSDMDVLTDINNLVGKEQCENADCCFDETLSTNAIEWIIGGLGGQKQYRCFRKSNPTIGADAATIEQDSKDKFPVNTLIDYNEGLNKYEDPAPKTCNSANWDTDKFPTMFKRSCGENLTYYQCVYQNRCCFQATVANEPVCYHPEAAKP